MNLLRSLLVLCMLSNLAFGLGADSGKWDYAYSAGLRSQPLGAAVWGELGYSHLLWGSAPSGQNPFYGYLRPKVSAQSSGIVNRADVGVDLAFWAPIVFEITHAWDHRGGDFEQFDCRVVQCRGLLTRTRAAIKLTVGYGANFLLWDSLLELVKGPASPERDFGDQSWALAGKYSKDTLLSSELTLGRKVSDVWSAGVVGAKSQFRDSQEKSSSLMGFVAFRQSGLRYFVGAGLYESTRIERGFTSAFGLKWVGSDSFSIR